MTEKQAFQTKISSNHSNLMWIMYCFSFDSVFTLIELEMFAHAYQQFPSQDETGQASNNTTIYITIKKYILKDNDIALQCSVYNKI